MSDEFDMVLDGQAEQKDEFDLVLGEVEKPKEQKSIVGSLISEVGEVAGALVSPSFYKGLVKGVYYSPEALESLGRKNYETILGDTIETYEPTEGQKRIEYLEEKIQKATPKEEGPEKLGMQVSRTLVENAPAFVAAAVTPGGMTAKAIAGATTSLVPTGMASRYDFLSQQRQFIRDAVKSGDIESFTQEDWDKLRGQYAELASYYGAAEAIPAAIGSLIQIPLLLGGPAGVAAVKPIGKMFSSLSSKFGGNKAYEIMIRALKSKPMSVAIASGSELGEEVVTELLQSSIEADPDVAIREEGKGIAEAIEDVGAVSMLAGGGPQALKESYKFYREKFTKKAETTEEATEEATAEASEDVKQTPRTIEGIAKRISEISPGRLGEVALDIAEKEGITLADIADIDEADAEVLATYIDNLPEDFFVSIEPEPVSIDEIDPEEIRNFEDTEILQVPDATQSTELQQDLDLPQEPELPQKPELPQEPIAIYEGTPEEEIISNVSPLYRDEVQAVVDSARDITSTTESLDSEAVIDTIARLAVIGANTNAPRAALDLANRVIADPVYSEGVVQDVSKLIPALENAAEAYRIFSPSEEVIVSQEQDPESESGVVETLEAVVPPKQKKGRKQKAKVTSPSTSTTTAANTAAASSPSVTQPMTPVAETDTKGIGLVTPEAADPYVNDIEVSETYTEATDEMDTEEYTDSIASGEGLRPYSILSDEVARKAVDYLKPEDFDIPIFKDIDITEFEYISLYSPHLMEAYKNSLPYRENRPSIQFSGYPIIFKSLGERLFNDYDRSSMQDLIAAGFYTESDYINEFYPQIRSDYEQMVMKMGNVEAFAKMSDQEVQDAINKNDKETPLAMMERDRRNNFLKAEMVSKPVEIKIIEKKSEDGSILIGREYKGNQFAAYLTVSSKDKTVLLPNGKTLLAGSDSVKKARAFARNYLRAAVYNVADSNFYSSDGQNLSKATDGAPSPRLSLIAPGNITVDDVRSVVGKMTGNADIGIKVNVVSTVSDLPHDVVDNLPQTPKGLYLKGVAHNGQIYIVSGNMSSMKDVYITLIHELSHIGFSRMLESVGKGTPAYNALIVQIYNLYSRNAPSVQSMAEDYGMPMDNNEQIIAATGEWLAYRAETKKPSAYRRFKAAINRFFGSIFGFNPMSVDDVDVMIDRIRSFTKVGNTFYAMAADSEVSSSVEMPAEAEKKFASGKKLPSDALSAIEKLIARFSDMMGNVVNPASWLSQFGIDTRKITPIEQKPYSIADDVLRRMTEARRTGSAVAMSEMKFILSPLGEDKNLYDMFSRYIYARDLQKDIELGLITQFGPDSRHGFLSADEFNTYFDGLSLMVDGTPVVKDAVDRRDAVVMRVYEDLISLKLIPVETLRDVRYFHHAVLKYIDDIGGGVSGRSAKVSKAGFAKGRTGTESDVDMYSTSYIEAEGEYLADAISRITFAEGMEEIKENFDIKPTINRIASVANMENAIAKENELIAKGEIDPSLDDTLDKYKKKIALAIDKILKSNSYEVAAAIKAMNPGYYTGVSIDNIGNKISDLRDEIHYYAKMKGITGSFARKAGFFVDEELANERFSEKDPVIVFLKSGENPALIIKMASHIVRDSSLDNSEISAISKFLLSQVSKRKAYIKNILGDEHQTYRTILKDAKNDVARRGDKASYFNKALAQYDEYDPKQNLGMYYTNTLSEYQLDQILKSGGKYVDVEKLRKTLSVAAPNNILIPEDIANGMNKFKPHNLSGIPESGFGRILSKLNSLSRFMLLFSPARVIPYATMNAVSDFGKAAIFFPKVVFSKKLTSENITRSMDIANAKYDSIAKKALAYRVIDSGVYMRDVESIRKIFGNDEMMSNFLNKTEQKTGMDEYVRKTSEVLDYLTSKYTNWVLTLNQIRENYQRLVVFQYVLENANNGVYIDGVTPEYIRRGVKALGNDAYAARIARDAIGDYGNLSENGVAMRNTLIYFYGFMETNFTAWVGYFRNVAKQELPKGFNGNFASNLEKAEWIGRVSARLGKAAIVPAMPMTLILLAAYALFPDEMEELIVTHDENKGGVVVPIGKKDPETGFIPTVSIADTYFDFLSWIGIDSPYKFAAVVAGKTGAIEAVAQAPIDGMKKAIGSFTGPLNIAGVVTGQSYFPDIFNPRPIERDDAVANMIGMGAPYRWITGKPSPGAGEVISMLPRTRYISPGEAKYRYAQKLVNNIRTDKGMSIVKFDIERSPRDYAKYMYRKSIQYGDKKSAQRWLDSFIEEGGKRSQLAYNMETTHPLAGLSGTGVSVSRFMSELRPTQREIIRDSIQWWRHFYGKVR